MMYVAVSALSHIGVVRDHHEDSLVAGPWTLRATVTESPQTLFFPLGTPLVVAVADGLGGHPGGEVASARRPAGSRKSGHSWIPRKGSARRSAPATVRCTRRRRASLH